jgi:predicted nuclease with TOPRIM domain
LQIERVVVEGGFLDGLDARFGPGLNVLIGARGTGKTSVIELIRFCLGVTSYTESSATRAREHALGVLGDGRITVTLADEKSSVDVWRTSDAGGTEAERFSKPIIFSQTDIESLGLQASGRLRLIDSFRKRRIDGDRIDQSLLASIRSQTLEMRQISKDLETIDGQLSSLQGLEKQLQALQQEEQTVAAQSSATKQKQRSLQKLTEQLASLTVSRDVVERTRTDLEKFYDRAETLTQFPPEVEMWPAEAGNEDRLISVRTDVNTAILDYRRANAKIRSSLESLSSTHNQIQAQRLPLEQSVREARREIESLHKGAGAVTKAVNAIREQIAQLNALRTLRTHKLDQLKEIRNRRGELLDELDQIWDRRFQDRVSVAEFLNTQLSPRIRVRPQRAAQLALYAGVIAAALRGSALRYNELSPVIASKVSPRELIELTEGGDSERLAQLTAISQERAQRVIAHLKDQSNEDILTVSVDDDVCFELLDGVDFKSIEHLSTGQRCTVILPITLEHQNRVLIVDQPEDHLDNAFIVETLIKAIHNRGAQGQLIFSSHNANIPVLGDASRVTVMGSDGRRGFVEYAGSLEDSATVEAITTVMEGGREAFERRARFYKSHTS